MPEQNGTTQPFQTFPPFDIPALRFIAARGCTFVNDNQPPRCSEEWPGEPWKWCGVCVAEEVVGV